MMVCSFGNLFHLASTCSVIPFQCPSYLRIQVKPGNPSRLFICFMVGITHPFTSIIGKRENKTKHTHTNFNRHTPSLSLRVCLCDFEGFLSQVSEFILGKLACPKAFSRWTNTTSPTSLVEGGNRGKWRCGGDASEYQFFSKRFEKWQ